MKIPKINHQTTEAIRRLHAFIFLLFMISFIFLWTFAFDSFSYQTSIKNSEKEMRDCYYNENECYRPIIRIMLFSVAQNSAPTLVVIIIFTYFAFSKTLHVGKAQSRAITSFRTLSNDSTASFYPSFRGDYTQGDVPFANDSTPLLQKEHEKKATEEENNNNNLDEVGYYFPFEGVLWKEFERENELHNNQTDDDGNFELDIKNFGVNSIYH